MLNYIVSYLVEPFASVPLLEILRAVAAGSMAIVFGYGVLMSLVVFA